MSGEIAAAEFGCPYVIAYVGRCNRFKGDSGFCEAHAERKCGSCGKQAVRECSYAGQFVCGTPLCDDCEGWEDPSKGGGSWGFMNHAHRMKPVERRKHVMREATAADFGIGG